MPSGVNHSTMFYRRKVRSGSRSYCACCRCGHRSRGSAFPLPPTLLTSIPSPGISNRFSRATVRSSDVSSRSSAGTPWPWWFVPIVRAPVSVAISPHMPRLQPSGKLASTISGEGAQTSFSVTWFISRGTPHPGPMQGPFLKGGSAVKI